MDRDSFFVTGGALLVDAGSYVERAADTELLKALRVGEFCYVLTTRQMGKTSLTVRTAAKLRDERWSVVVLDLTAFGQNLDVEQWYFSMLSDVGAKLRIEDEMEAYWEANLRRAPLHRFMGAIRECYLERARKPLAIFVDEIDVVRSLRQFRADEFFAGIRECYNRRSEDPIFARLTFCLLGVATPSDLISDQRMTPFNIGRGIELADFTVEEASVLAAGLSPSRATALELLDRVLNWTGGHPYLTQRLCAEVQKAGIAVPSAVDAICTRIYLSADARNRDENLQFVRERLLRSDLDRAALLDTYAKVCRGERVIEDDHNAMHNELRLAGIVRVVDGCLRPRNRIYTQVFDLKWVRENLPDAEARRQRAAYWRGVRRVTGVACTVLAVMGLLVVKIKGIAHDAKIERDKANDASKRARESAARERITAKQATDALDGQKKAAEQARVAAGVAQSALAREKKANQASLEQEKRTEAALKRLVDTQTKVAALLEGLTPLVGQNGGNNILERAEDLVKGLSSEENDDPRIRLGLALLQRICGHLYLRLGNEDKAREQTDAARKIVEAELDRKPSQDQPGQQSDPDALNKLLYECEMLVGDIMLSDRASDVVQRKTPEDYDRALQAYREAVELARTQCAAHPDDAAWRKLYFAGWTTIGETGTLFDRSEDAQKRFSEALTEVTAMREKLPNAPDLVRIEAGFHDQLGSLYRVRNKREQAREEFVRALQLREGAKTDNEVDEPERLSDIALSYNKLGNLALEAKDLPEALANYQRSLDMRQELYDKNPRLDWARNLSLTLANTTTALWRSGQKEQAMHFAEERFNLAEKLLNRDNQDGNLRYDYANALFNYAYILLNVKEAEKNWPQVLELARDGVKRTERGDPRILTLLAQALRHNQLPDEARAVAKEASRLLPAEDKRTDRDKETAKELDLELSQSKPPVSKGTRPPKKPE